MTSDNPSTTQGHRETVYENNLFTIEDDTEICSSSLTVSIV